MLPNDGFVLSWACVSASFIRFSRPFLARRTTSSLSDRISTSMSSGGGGGRAEPLPEEERTATALAEEEAGPSGAGGQAEEEGVGGGAGEEEEEVEEGGGGMIASLVSAERPSVKNPGWAHTAGGAVGGPWPRPQPVNSLSMTSLNSAWAIDLAGRKTG
jgi:hypothetical protein